MRFVLVFSAAALLVSSPIWAQDDDDAFTPGPEECPKIQASTIFVKDKTGSRQSGSAERISETHDTAEAQGWNYSDLQVYIEDGDLQGFFITYTREHPCNKE